MACPTVHAHGAKQGARTLRHFPLQYMQHARLALARSIGFVSDLDTLSRTSTPGMGDGMGGSHAGVGIDPSPIC